MFAKEDQSTYEYIFVYVYIYMYVYIWCSCCSSVYPRNVIYLFLELSKAGVFLVFAFTIFSTFYCVGTYSVPFED